jgi:uncharacterized protein (DUF1330 family)
MQSIQVVVRLWIDPSRVQEFESYERKAARIMARHGGAVLESVRTSETDAPAGDAPFEVHVLEFPSPEAFNAYRTDPELAALAAEREMAITRTEVLAGCA